MNCPKCGGEILNDRCMQCGETVEPQPQEPELTLEPPIEPEQAAPQQPEAQQPEAQPQPPSYQDYQQGYQPPQEQGGYQQQGGYQAPPPPPVKHPNNVLYIVLGIVQILMCCGPNIPGILLLVWNSQLNRAFMAGDQAETARLEKNTKICMILGFVFPVVVWVLYIVAVMFLGFAAIGGGYYY